ncbi:hypothetical protein [Phyllobacterium lublinensis]|uniref:hypothetical protein n=1 Tax=Phyllobacterium lublinensis TaxID=2875708 RepID=UPI001CCEB16E|nr:hypothetical protein [Phyllobacterium sp. 2063]MBZ9657307.1 hypothetical protein [Phyllobacterium sp. 2063]
MRFSTFDIGYSQQDSRTLEWAHCRACFLLGRDPSLDPLAERVALSIIIFFERGERDFGRLACMAVKREYNLMKLGRPNEPHFAPGSLQSDSIGPDI